MKRALITREIANSSHQVSELPESHNRAATLGAVSQWQAQEQGLMGVGWDGPAIHQPASRDGPPTKAARTTVTGPMDATAAIDDAITNALEHDQQSICEGTAGFLQIC